MKDGRQALFLFLPEGEDPDTIVRKEGPEGFDTRLREAMPLSEFFFADMSKDVNLGTLDGKARLAERCKPLLAQIPDGAFGDLMRQRLTELTGVGARASTPETHVPAQRARNAPAIHAPKQSLVRSAIVRLLHQPALAMMLEPPYRFALLRQPGVELLADIVALVRERPEITTGALLEHFSDREEAVALQKLATQTLPGEEALWRNEFADVMAQLEKQMLQQRIEELQAKNRESGLDIRDKEEMRALLGNLNASRL
jgi:DNA primase